MKIIPIILVAAIVIFFIINTLKTTNYRKLVTYLEHGDFKTFHQKIDSSFMKMLFPKSSILDLKFNAALIEQNKKEAIALLEQLTSMPLTTGQKEAYYMKAFNLFVGLQDKKNAQRYLDLINKGTNDRMKSEANRVFNIYILKNDHDLKDLLVELEGMEDYQKGVNEYLISLIYKNKKDISNAKKYAELSKQHFSLVDEQTAKKYQK